MFVGRSITCRQKTPTQLLDNLEVKPKFREPGLEASEQIYSDSILELQKMDLCITPKDKLVQYQLISGLLNYVQFKNESICD